MTFSGLRSRWVMPRVRARESAGQSRAPCPATLTATAGVPSGDLVPQRLAVDELGGDEQLAVQFLERVDGADAGMRQRRRRPRFAAQPLAL